MRSEKRKEYMKNYLKEYRQRNSLKIKTVLHNWYIKNKEKRKLLNRDYYLTHKDRCNTLSAKWNTENRERRNYCIRKQYKNDKSKFELRGKKYIQKIKTEFPWKRTLAFIKARCEHPKQPAYKYYGGKGIKNFLTNKDLEMMWHRDKAYEMKRPSIDRIDSKGDYTIENCRYLEISENARRSALERIAKKQVA